MGLSVRFRFFDFIVAPRLKHYKKLYGVFTHAIRSGGTRVVWFCADTKGARKSSRIIHLLSGEKKKRGSGGRGWSFLFCVFVGNNSIFRKKRCIHCLPSDAQTFLCTMLNSRHVSVESTRFPYVTSSL